MMNGQFEIVYCQLSDGTPCANWAWRGKTPAAVAVLERRGTRRDRVKQMIYGRGAGNRSLRQQLARRVIADIYRDWTNMLMAERVYIKQIIDEVMAEHTP